MYAKRFNKFCKEITIEKQGVFINESLKLSTANSKIDINSGKS